MTTLRPRRAAASAAVTPLAVPPGITVVPVETIIDTAREVNADIIGLSGLITPSLEEMRIVAAEIPVMGHVGLTPQAIHRMGGHRVQGRTDKSRARVLVTVGDFLDTRYVELLRGAMGGAAGERPGADGS